MQENNKCRGGLRDNLENKFLEKSINTNDVIARDRYISMDGTIYIFVKLRF